MATYTLVVQSMSDDQLELLTSALRDRAEQYTASGARNMAQALFTLIEDLEVEAERCVECGLMPVGDSNPEHFPTCSQMATK